MLALIFEKSAGQCPNSAFSLPDTACAGQNVFPLNTSSGTGPLHFEWDFSIGDLSNNPSGSVLGNFSSLTNSLGLDYIISNDTIYAAGITNAGLLSVLNFGTSFSNIPVVSTYANPGGLNGGWDLEIVKENGNYIAIISGLFNNVIYRADFGNSMLNSPTISSISSPLFNWPGGIKTINDQGTCYILAVNLLGGSISILNLGNSFLNAVSSSGNIAIGTADPFGISIIKDCDHWYGYINYLSSPTVSLIDFGNSITSTPLSYTPSAFTLPFNARKSFALKDGNDWHVLFCSSSRNSIARVKLGNNPTSPSPAITDLGSFGVYTNHFATSIHKKGSRFFGIASNFDNGDLINFFFPENLPGAVSNDSSTSYNFPVPGRYLTSLTAIDPVNNTSTTYVDSIIINPSPVPGFTLPAACENTQIQLTDSSSLTTPAIISQDWDWGDGNTSSGDTVSHIYTTAGNYIINLISTNALGCSRSFSDTITVNYNPVAGFSALQQACSGVPIAFTDTSSVVNSMIQNWHWNFGNGDTLNSNNPFYSYETSGQFTIRLTVISAQGCSDTINKAIDILPSPVASFNVFNTCIGENSQFINNTIFSGTGALTYSWNLDDNTTSSAINPTHTYPPVPGQYQITLTAQAANGCSDSASDSIRTGNKPIPSFIFTPDTACVGNDIQFESISFAATGDTIIHHIWDFGDNTFDSTSLNPVHQYLAAGSYNVKLKVVSPTWCDSVITANVFVIESPSASFITADNCFGQLSSFNNQSSAPSGDSVSVWTWSFGDGDSSLLQSPSHNYLQAGSYNVILQVISNTGCKDTSQQTINIFPKPSANFGSSNACTSSPVQFSDSSTISNGNISLWEWDFGNGSPLSNQQNPQTTYQNSLAYPVQLIVASDKGCKDTINKMIVVQQSPVFTISANDHCEGTPAFFSYNTGQPGSNNNSFLWLFGDSTASFLPNPSHLYSEPGQYNYSLEVTDISNGCITKRSDTISVFNLPQAGFTFGNACVGSPINFADSSYVPTGTISSWNWNFNNSGGSTQPNPQFIFSSPGVYQIQLNVISNEGCPDSLMRPITVNDLPIVSFIATPDYGAPPLQVQFNNSSSPGNYSWNFGDNSSPSGQINPQHIYSDTGIFNVTLITIDAFGCKDSVSSQVFVLVPYPDLAINGVSFVNENNRWQMKALVSNNGNEDFTSFELKAELDRESIFYETFDNDTLKAGKAKEITFNTRIEKSNSTPSYFCAEVVKVNRKNDANPENNRFCISTTDQFEVFNIYPNPFYDILYANINMDKKGVVQFEIFDINGKLCVEIQNFELPQGLSTVSIPYKQLSSGIYILRITHEGFNRYIKLSKY